MDSNIQASVGRDKREAEMRTMCHLIVADGKGGPPSSSFTHFNAQALSPVMGAISCSCSGRWGTSMTCFDHCKEAEVKSGIPKSALEGTLQSCCQRKDIVTREILIYRAAERSQRLWQPSIFMEKKLASWEESWTLDDCVLSSQRPLDV